MNLGSNVKRIREFRNLTRETLASELNMSLSGYSKIERNEVDLTFSRLEKICKILEVSISLLLNFDSKIELSRSLNGIVDSDIIKAETYNYKSNDYIDKYIAMLEEENRRLRIELTKYK